MQYKKRLINKFQIDVWIYSLERKINIEKCLVSEQDLKKKERSIRKTQADKLTFLCVSKFTVFSVCDM